jgi:hypothetical protein
VTTTPYEDLRDSIVGIDDPGTTELDALRAMAADASLETRRHLAAWHALRAQGIEPDDGERRVVRGVVCEVGLDHGTDVLAAYADRSARYFNASGGGVFWDQRRDDIDGMIDAYLEAGQAVADATGPLEEPLFPVATAGTMTILLLTFGGIHLGTGPVDVLMGDPLGSAVTSAALPLMQALVEVGTTT